MTTRVAARYRRFGNCVVDLQRRLLWRDGALVPLTAKPFDVLAFLIDHPNRLVEKSELLDALWPDTVVLEANLVRQISLLRKAFHQLPGVHDYIVTIPGRGYEFVASIEQLAELPSGIVEPARPSETPPGAVVGSVVGTERRWLHVMAWGAGLALILVILGTLVTAWPESERRSTSPPARTLRQYTYEPGAPREPAWSPDGAWIAFTADAGGNTDIWRQSAGDPTPLRLTTDPARDSAPSWSPDGRRIAFRSEREGGGIYTISPTGDDDRRVSSFGFHPQWSPDGRWILFSGPTVRTGSRRVYVVSPEGGSAREVLSDVIARFTSVGSTSLGWLNAVDVAWHPDGRRISVWGQAADGRWRFVTAPLDGGAPIESGMPEPVLARLVRERLHLGRFVWSPSGRYVYFEGRTEDTQNIWRVAVDSRTLTWLDGPERLTTGSGEERDIALSGDGRRLAFSAGSTRTRVWGLEFDPRTGRVVGSGRPLTSGSAGEMEVDSSPDGRKLAYRTTRAGRNEVWELDTEKHQERLLLASTGWRPTTPRWSADGRRLAFARTDVVAPDLVPAVSVLSTEAGEERQLLLPSGAYLVPTDWSADGGLILGSCRFAVDDPMSVCAMSTRGEAAPADLRALARDATKNLWVPRFSPDQRWIAFLAVDVQDAPTSTVYVVPADGGEWIQLTDGLSFDDKPRWSPDGRTIFFVSSRDGFLDVWGRRFDPQEGRLVGESFRVTSFSGQERILPANISRLEFSVTRDQLFLPLSDTVGDLWILDDVDR